MRYETPQFIEVEAKIVGFLTLKQFIWIALAFGINVFLFLVFRPFVMFILGLPITILAIALGFIKIDGLSLGRYLLKAMGFAFKPKLYVWKKKEES
jgi:hypothetical protein